MTVPAAWISPGSTGFFLLCFLSFLILVNALTYASFGMDKRRALDGDWRVPEGRLLLLALLGGWVGAKLAQRRFRHKTRKQPFGAMLNGIGLLYLGLGVLVFSPLGAMALQAIRNADMDMARLTGLLTGAEEEEEARALPRRFGPGS